MGKNISFFVILLSLRKKYLLDFVFVVIIVIVYYVFFMLFLHAVEFYQKIIHLLRKFMEFRNNLFQYQQGPDI